MFAQVALLCLASLAAAQYQPHYDGAYAKPYAAPYEEPPHPYSFGYDVKDEHGATLNRREESDEHGYKKGSYGYTDGYGVYRQVDYVADEHGFRATVKTNEPGTENQDPADVQIISEAVKYEAAAPTYGGHAPAYGPKYQAPVYGAEPKYQAPVYGAEHKYQAPVYSAEHKYQAPVYGAEHKYQAPVYGAEPKYQAPVYGAESKYQAPVYGEDKYQAPVYGAEPKYQSPVYPAPVYQPEPPQYPAAPHSAQYEGADVYEGPSDSYAPY